MLAFIISANLNVKSSSPLAVSLNAIDGLTGGGGTGKTVINIHSGLA